MSTTPPLSDADRAHLGRAVALGRRGWGRVHPNPMVGCVLVRDGEVVAEGWHGEFGGPHAETVALEAAGPAARGATAYVSLEPCRHEGKTPACTRALMASGVARVVFGAADPGAESGGGGAELARAGIEVVGPVFDEPEAHSLNPAFHHRFASALPWVALKLAVSLDGRIAEREGVRTALSGSESAAAVHTLRAGFDGILVGGATGRVDDPLLTVRGAVEPRVPPVRIVLDPAAAISSDAAVFEAAAEVPLWVFTRDDAAEAELERLETAGASVHPVPAIGPHELDLGHVLRHCAVAGVGAILCEGGGRLAASLLNGDFVRRLYWVVVPRLLGTEGVPAFPDVVGSDAAGVVWTPAEPARLRGPDTWITLDRREA
ncbi:MAG: bifunctional diaminohydroxyphosphoribosylaminopyrimidine deaminase/5-amino-6-(5-phosphoribosylamino)uracil reductase RibD [Gemmatimonadetes bacterium]|nr:bifunctional diaminohydroxyphosphoribosylaminopyrimidine deaminase/5-amino-6-(5-phosphoribosylamino)uracil reductase RibD [Gemmatimonadota bacterium]